MGALSSSPQNHQVLERGYAVFNGDHIEVVAPVLDDVTMRVPCGAVTMGIWDEAVLGAPDAPIWSAAMELGPHVLQP